MHLSSLGYSMRIRRFYLFSLIFPATLWLAIASSSAQQDIGSVVVDVDRETISVIVRSSDSQTLKGLRTAFNMHGGYRLVDRAAEASFVFEIDPVGSSGARLSIYSGIPEQRQFTQTLAGSSSRNALFKAIDTAIFKTSGKPGFFSGRLCFVGEASGRTEIYVSDFLFGDLVRMTSDRVDAVRPRWSPDGRYIAYTSYKSSYPDIYRINMTSNRRETLVSLEGTNTSAIYSPAGDRMAMILTGKGNAEVYVGNNKGGQLKRLTRNRSLEASPCWSPDGQRLLVTSDMGGGPQLYLLSAYGGSMRRVRTDISGNCSEPSWSFANQDLISFTAAMRNTFQIAVYDFSKGKSEFVTSERGLAVESEWLNDGRHLIYTLKTGSSKRIILLDTVSRRRTVISPERLGDVSQASFLPPR